MTRLAGAVGYALLLGPLALGLVAGCAVPGPAAVPAAPGVAAPSVEAPSVEAPSVEAVAAGGDVNVPTPSLLDLRVPALRARFGEPRGTRRDGGAEIWTYEASGTCRLNLVLQRERGAQKVVHAQARMVAGGTEARCLRALERGR